jgi:hypothetical protein
MFEMWAPSTIKSITPVLSAVVRLRSLHRLRTLAVWSSHEAGGAGGLCAAAESCMAGTAALWRRAAAARTRPRCRTASITAGGLLGVGLGVSSSGALSGEWCALVLSAL